MARRVFIGVVFLIAAGLSSMVLAQNKSLPASLTQNQWVGAKQSVDLSTGINMKFVEMGQAKGAPLIFLHGMTDNSRSWSLAVPYFTHKYHVYMLDQRGHGDSGKPDLRMYSMAMYAADLAAFMEAMGIEKAHIVGHSLGSMIAQTFALNYPEKTLTLVLEASAIPADNGRELYDAALSFGENQPDDEFMAAWYANPNPVDEDFLKREMAESKKIPPHAWRAITKGFAAVDLRPLMDEIKAPTLIMWGTEDSFFGLEQQEALRQAIPQAEFIVYDKFGHNLQWEAPEKTAQDILKFLDKN